MTRIISDYKKIDRVEWVDFVFNHPQGNIFHSPEIVDLYELTPKTLPVVVASIDPSGKPDGILVAVIQQEYRGFIGKLTARAIVWGGPLAKDNNSEIASEILVHFDRYCRKKAIYAQFRNLWDTSLLKSSFEKNQYAYEDHLDIIFDLGKGKDVLWNAVDSSRRKQINRGIKRGISAKVEDGLNEEQLKTCYTILAQVYRKVKLPYPGIDFFKNSIRIFSAGRHFKAVLAYFNNEIIGFRFFLCYKGLLYDWYAGSLAEHYEKYPNDILPWEIIRWGADHGFSAFDFGGAGKPNVPYGVRDYKMKFGGELVNFGRFEKVYQPAAMSIAKAGFRLWKLVKK